MHIFDCENLNLFLIFYLFTTNIYLAKWFVQAAIQRKLKENENITTGCRGSLKNTWTQRQKKNFVFFSIQISVIDKNLKLSLSTFRCSSNECCANCSKAINKTIYLTKHSVPYSNQLVRSIQGKLLWTDEFSLFSKQIYLDETKTQTNGWIILLMYFPEQKKAIYIVRTIKKNILI